MTTNARSTNATQTRSAKSTTLEMVALCCPDSAQMTAIAESFGLDILDTDGIRDTHHRMTVESAEALRDALSDKAMQIHLQRIVGSYVGSAYGAGQFYSKAVSEARAASAKLMNDTRDEDLDGPAGFDSRAQRKREFAADVGLQAHALRCAAEGAVAAYKEVLGEDWKPYKRHVENPGSTVSRQAVELQMAAFG